MKTIIIPLFDGMIARNFLYTDVIQELIKHNIRVVLLAPVGKGDLYEKKFADGKKVFVESTDDLWKNSRTDSMLQNMFLQSIPTRFMRIRQVDWYWNQKKYIHYLGVSILRFLGQFHLYRTCIRRFAFLQPIRPEVKTLFDTWKPDMVFAPTMIPAVEVQLLRLAKQRRVSTVGMAKSWDNFSSKAFIRVFPDWIVVHNKLQINEASKLFDYPKERVVVTGIPQLDRYRDRDFIEPRASFCSKLGLNPELPILLYAPAGDWMNPNDKETLEMILDWIDAGELSDCQVLLRLHPGYTSRTEELRGRKGLVIERPGKQDGVRLKNVEFEEDDIRHLASSLKHAAVVLHTASTMGVEAAYLDRPVIHIGFDGKQVLPYWKSVIRYYDREHCVPLVSTGGGRLVRNGQEMKTAINEYLKDPTLDEGGREVLVNQVCYSTDGKAGERLGKFIADTVNEQ